MMKLYSQHCTEVHLNHAQVFHYEWPAQRKKEELALIEKKEEGAGTK
jgi:hypothetical protein